MLKRIFLLFLLTALLCTPFHLVAADDEEPDVKDIPFRERIIVGGNLGLQISNINIMVVISPLVGYRITNRLTSGGGLTYQYYRDSGWAGLTGFTTVTHIYGGSVFSRYQITRDFFAHAEYEALNLDSQLNWEVNPETRSRFWEHNYFLGGGYRAALSDRTHLNLMVLYNFNRDSRVYFQNPVFRVGIDVRL
ncbi:MAG: hypothetical protein ACOCX0_02710 [Bacteroidota bacterium]